MKVKGFLKDVGGASRVTKARLNAFETASAQPVREDPIGNVAREWHPGKLELVVDRIYPVSPTAKTVRFVRADGKKLPPFYAGQFISLEFNVNGEIVSRPYSLSSAPYEARQEKGYVEITVRRSKGDGFIAAHGDFTEPEKFFYVEDEEDARVNFGSSGAQLMFVGHTHVPGLFLTGGSGRVYATEAQDFTLEEGKRYIVNPGSVGYPRERGGKCLSSYVLYDSTEKTVVFRYLPFSVSTVLQRGTPRRWPRLAFWGALVAAVAAAVAALLFARFQTPGAVAPPDAGLLVESVELDVSTARKASANLKLERSSCPLQLSVVFKSEDGGRLGEERLTVRRSSMKRFNVPEGARKAVFELRKNGIDDKPAVSSFRPSAVR